MPRGRQLAPLTIPAADRAQLEEVANSTSMPQAVVLRARMILASSEGLTNSDVARQVGASPQAVGKWRKRYLDGGIDGLRDEPRPGRPRTFDDEKVARVINRALQEKPADGTHWSTHSMAAAEGVSASTVSRWFRLYGVKPHQAKTVELAADPLFIEKVRDITGLYLNPPDHAMVLCVDEKSQTQTLDRTQPPRPKDLGYVEGYTHDNLHYGTTTLFEALDIVTGKSVDTCQAPRRQEEFLAFLRLIDRDVPADLDVHLVLDNSATREHAAVKRWLAERPRFQMHCTPPYSSWLKEVEHWFGLLGEKALKRGRSRSAGELVDQIQALTAGHNEVAKPFVWVATTESIVDQVERLSTRMSETGH